MALARLMYSITKQTNKSVLNLDSEGIARMQLASCWAPLQLAFDNCR